MTQQLRCNVVLSELAKEVRALVDGKIPVPDQADYCTGRLGN